MIWSTAWRLGTLPAALSMWGPAESGGCHVSWMQRQRCVDREGQCRVGTIAANRNSPLTPCPLAVWPTLQTLEARFWGGLVGIGWSGGLVGETACGGLFGAGSLVRAMFCLGWAVWDGSLGCLGWLLRAGCLFGPLSHSPHTANILTLRWQTRSGAVESTTGDVLKVLVPDPSQLRRTTPGRERAVRAPSHTLARALHSERAAM